jgi:phosphoheptose isomerase
MNKAREQISEHIRVMETVAADGRADGKPPAGRLRIVERLKNGGKVLFCGNGGSARRQPASLAAEFVGRTARTQGAGGRGADDRHLHSDGRGQ